MSCHYFTSSFFFIPSDDIFKRSHWVNIYLRKYHKQIDDASKKTLLELAEGKHEQYLEFLLQRLLVLDEKDFAVIRENGGGIEAISSYFCNLLRKQPNNLEDITCRMSEYLQEVINSKFVRSVTGMLLAAPYGLSEQFIRDIDSEKSIGYSRLNMRTFCRAYAPLLVETLDGYIRFNDTPATDILREHFRIDIKRGAEYLESYMRTLLEDKTEHEAILRNQYLQIAFHAEANKALVCYIRAFQKDPEQISVALWELMMSHNGADIWLQNEMSAFSLEECSVIAYEIYPLFRFNGWINNTVMKIWESYRESASKNLSSNLSHKTLGLIFCLLYQCGEMAYILDNPKAEYYLMSAKKISKLDFKVSHNKNEHGRNVFGRSLTSEEIDRLGNFLRENRENHSLKGNGIVSAINFTELANIFIKQSWSHMIYVIDRWLLDIYKERGDIQKADALQGEAEEIAKLIGIDNQDAEERVPLAEDHAATGKKKSYRPDFRRDIAIRIRQKAIELQENEEHQAAFEKLEESNEILREIYNDGEDKKYYDLSGAGGDPEQAAEYIRSECLRDMSINFSAMSRSADAMKMPDEKIIELLEMMLKNGRAFDNARNSKESKLNLKNCYYTAANVCFSCLENSDYLRCLSYCEKYFHYREEAFAKGEDWSDDVSESWRNVVAVFYQCVTQQPGQGSRATNILYEISKKSVMYNDLIGYAGYTNLASDLLVWTRQNGMNWACEQTSLESVYINQVRITCAMWEQNQEWLLLEHDASKLEQMIDYILENDSRTKAADILSLLGLYYFQQSDYDKAVSVFGHVMKCLIDDGKIICSFVTWLHHQNRYVSALSEAGNFDEAELEAEKEETYINDYLQEKIGSTQDTEQEVNYPRFYKRG